MQWLDMEPGYLSYLSDESHRVGRGEKIGFPETFEEAAQGVREAAAVGVPLTIQGARTGLAGGASPEGGWVLNLSRLSGMEAPEGDRVRVQAGLTLEALQKKLAPLHLAFRPDPTEETATLGGMFSTNSAGPCTLAYGKTGDHVLGVLRLTKAGELQQINRGDYIADEKGNLALPEGGTLKTEPVRDLLDCMAGAEGTLGTVLSLDLQLYPAPKEVWAILFFFSTEEKALEFAEGLQTLRNQGAPICAGEYLDPGALDLLKTHSSHPGLRGLPPLPEAGRAAIYTELQGQEDLTPALMDLLDLFEAQGGQEELSWAESDGAGIRRLRQLRHAVPEILGELPQIRGPEGIRYEGDFLGRPGDQEAWLLEYRRLLRDREIPGVIYGHLLTNGLRLALVPETEDQRKACPELLRELTEFAARTGGDLSGEYGRGKKPWLKGR